jgi:hypothetical protein
MMGGSDRSIDQEMATLANGLPHLRQINIGSTQLSDIGLASLLTKADAAAAPITVINIQDCRLVTDAFRASIRHSHPNVTIHEDNDGEPKKPTARPGRGGFRDIRNGHRNVYTKELSMAGHGNAEICDKCHTATRPRYTYRDTTTYCHQCKQSLCEHCCAQAHFMYCHLCDEQACTSCSDKDAWLGRCDLCGDICGQHPELTLRHCNRCGHELCTACVEKPTEILEDGDDDKEGFTFIAGCPAAGHDFDGDT